MVKRATLLLVCLALLGSCSILFNPANAPGPSCPVGVDSCPARASAVPACEAERCVYSCVQGTVDLNRDLAAAEGSDGCETACADLTAPLPAPASLQAYAGVATQALTFEWPEVSAQGEGRRVNGYRLCSGPPQDVEASCVEVTPAECSAGLCRHAVGALANNARVYARVQSLDGCGLRSATASSPGTSATPINGVWANGQDWSAPESNCGGTATFENGVLTLTQPGGICVTLTHAGDNLWRDLTVEAQLLLPADAGGGFSAGLTLRSDSGRRNAFVVSSTASDSAEPSGIYRKESGELFDTRLATAPVAVEPNLWHWLRVVAHEEQLSLSVGDSLDAMTEVARVADKNFALKAGRIGLGVVGGSAARAQFRNVRLSTGSALPARGPTSASYAFANGLLPPELRWAPRDAQPNRVKVVACPAAYPVAADCASGATCGPRPGSRCLELAPVAFGAAALAVPLPVGIDSEQPWTLAFTIGLGAGAGVNTALVRASPGALAATPPAGGGTHLRGMEQDLGKDLTAGTWHRLEYTFKPDRFDLTWNGTKLLSDKSYPAAWTQLRGVILFQDAPMHVTDVELHQP